MFITTTLPAAILETVLTRLATLFLTGAGGDAVAARQAGFQMLGAYHPETEDELRLAANIVCFSFQALEALSQAAAPELPLTRIISLRGGAVSLSRESAKAERRLVQLQKARQQGIQAQPAEIQPERVARHPFLVAHSDPTTVLRLHLNSPQVTGSPSAQTPYTFRISSP